MREILFRGKAKPGEDAAGEWVLGDLLRNEDLQNPITHIGWVEVYRDKTTGKICEKTRYFNEVIPESVGQYTGVKDKNGVKIFEGDIVKISDKYIDCVAFETGCFLMKKQLFNYEFTYQDPESMEVIGNIYDNPELLETE